MLYIFTAILSENTENGEITARFPDLPGCCAKGKDLAQAIKNAQEALAFFVFDLEQQGYNIPAPTHPQQIVLQPKEFSSTVIADLRPYQKDYGGSVTLNTNISIPAWLFEKAESKKINFSTALIKGIKLESGFGIVEPKEYYQKKSGFSTIAENPELNELHWNEHVVSQQTDIREEQSSSYPESHSDSEFHREPRFRPRHKEESSRALKVVVGFLCLLAILVMALLIYIFVTDATFASLTERILSGQEAPVYNSYNNGANYYPFYENNGISREISALRQEFDNEDIIGHLWIENTSINYLVVQRDNEFYLYHDILGNPSEAGWIFLDYSVDLGSDNHNIVIYGLDMEDNIRFHSLRYFSNYDFFTAHSIIDFYTMYGHTQWELFSFYVTTADFPYYHVNFPNDITYEFWLERFIEAGIHPVDITLTARDRILTLSTWADEYTDARFVLQARLL